MQSLIADVRAQWQELDRRIAVFDAEFAAFSKETKMRGDWRRFLASAL